MLLVDITTTPKKAFNRGVVKGLAAPVLLFAQFQAQPLIFPAPIDLNVINPNSGIVNAFSKVTGDLYKSIGNNGSREK